MDKKAASQTSEFSRLVRISKRTVDDAKPGLDRVTFWDTDLRGFGLRVTPQGTKTYIVRYRAGGGRRGVPRQMVIGRHGPLTAEEARVRARVILGQVAGGQDPQADKAAARAEMTVAELCDLYLREGIATKKESTVKLDHIRIGRHIKPGIGRLRISEVRRADVERLMRDIMSGKIKGEATAHTRGGRGAAARTVGLLGGIFSFAIDRRLLAESPTAGVKRPSDVRRERFLSPKEIERLADVMGALTDGTRPRSRAEGAVVTTQHTQIIQMLLLTGARKNEIVRLRWSEVELLTGHLRLEDSKTGARVVPLGAAAAEALRSIEKTSETWVFPDAKDPGQPVRNIDWAWVCIRNAADLSDVRIHDLRHTFASVALMGGSNLAFIGKLLGHRHTQTTARYAHLADDPVKAAADRISNAMAAAMRGDDEEVEPFRRNLALIAK